MIYLFSHNDLDGIGCGILAKLAYKDRVEVRYNSIARHDTQIQRFLEKMNKKSSLIITDLAVNDENALRITEMHKKGQDIILIDHHKTSMKLNEFPWGRVKVVQDDGNLTCATSLLYEYFQEQNILKPTKTLTEFVELVRLYDTWEWEKQDVKEAKQLNDLFSIYSIDEFQELMMSRLLHEEGFSFSEFEDKILSIEEEKTQRYIRRKRREIVQTFINDYCVGVVHADSNHSELGNDLGKTFQHLDYIAIVNVGGKRISFRTIHDHIDVSSIAGEYGGGGHAKASGCSMDDAAFKNFVQDIFHEDTLMADPEQNQHNLKKSPKGTLFENRQKEQYLILPSGSEEWIISINGEQKHESFPSFEKAEEYLKRQFSVWLSRDDSYIDFMAKQDISIKQS
ncbi:MULTISPECIES: DHH family phosphoesterase [unclassified Bacillus (in: firmicutes)]|uniref:DHH family phosphoesterase n=1 Tax=unclassified Bacillus (in: firmicutes) TaxID=185979 RepID=UPI0008E1FC44|nr:MULTISPECIES: DHH family phosphoesterase [unclassified Bacillus (in: firmicutes)]SFQ85562.1 DHH family protein [Bacillus sp. cl95]